MTPVVCPTITSSTPSDYAKEMAVAEGFATRVHIDFADKDFTPVELLGTAQAWLPEGIDADLHVMLAQPEKEFKTLLSLKPRTMILHVESTGDLLGLLHELASMEVVPGIALLPESQPYDYANLIEASRHVLLFGGKLGYHGGNADLTLLKKVAEIRSIKPDMEIGWDGGINDKNAALLAETGIDVLNVGGFIQSADDPRAAYDILTQSISNINDN